MEYKCVEFAEELPKTPSGKLDVQRKTCCLAFTLPLFA